MLTQVRLSLSPFPLSFFPSQHVIAGRFSAVRIASLMSCDAPLRAVMMGMDFVADAVWLLRREHPASVRKRDLFLPFFL